MSNEKITTTPLALEERRCSNPKCNKLLFKVKGIIGLLEIKCKCGRMNLFKW